MMSAGLSYFSLKKPATISSLAAYSQKTIEMFVIVWKPSETNIFGTYYTPCRYSFVFKHQGLNT